VSNGRNNNKKRSKLSGFDKAAQALTKGLSPEAAQNFTSMVKDVATEYSYNDSTMIRRLRSRLNQAARSKNSWAHEVLEKLKQAEGVTA
jgi:hypothetical protein